jgi:DNA-binding response OmpR family regulator
VVVSVLIIEDDSAVREVVEHALARAGVRTRAVASGEEGLACLKDAQERFDLVVLDVMLPGIDGVSVLREIRAGKVAEASKDVPVLMLSARDDETSVVVGLELGADDYVTKPFRPRELVSRVRAHLRRQGLNGRNSRPRLRFPGLEIHPLARKVISQGVPVSLTLSEFEVLIFLASSPGQIFSRRQIMEHLRGGDFYGGERSADVHVLQIRRKIEPDPENPRYLLTVRGMGYKFADFS